MEYTPAGVPDIAVGCYRGLYIAFEVKNAKFKDPYKELSYEQKVHFGMILEAEGLAFCVNSVKQVKDILDGIDKELDG